MSTVYTNDKHYKEIASKIRTVLGTSDEYKPSEMPQAISSMTGSAVEDYSTIVNGAMFNDDTATIIGTKMYAGTFAGSTVKRVEIPNGVTTISKHAFHYSYVEEIIIPDTVQTFDANCFDNTYNLKHLDFPKNLRVLGYRCLALTNISENIVLPSSVNTIEDNAFMSSDFTGIELPSGVTSVGYAALSGCIYLKTLVIRASSVLGVDEHKTPLSSSAISKGNGYIYVPSALINSYKSNTYWSQYANQFRALEDYTVDGTVTGAFDYSRV